MNSFQVVLAFNCPRKVLLVWLARLDYARQGIVFVFWTKFQGQIEWVVFAERMGHPELNILARWWYTSPTQCYQSFGGLGVQGRTTETRTKHTC